MYKLENLKLWKTLLNLGFEKIKLTAKNFSFNGLRLVMDNKEIITIEPNLNNKKEYYVLSNFSNNVTVYGSMIICKNSQDIKKAVIKYLCEPVKDDSIISYENKFKMIEIQEKLL